MPWFAHAIDRPLNFELIRQNESLKYPPAKLPGKREAGRVYVLQAKSKELNI
jgi:hypothetical protein